MVRVVEDVKEDLRRALAEKESELYKALLVERRLMEGNLPQESCPCSYVIPERQRAVAHILCCVGRCALARMGFVQGQQRLCLHQLALVAPRPRFAEHHVVPAKQGLS
jgi:hypothetical protein